MGLGGYDSSRGLLTRAAAPGCGDAKQRTEQDKQKSDCADLKHVFTSSRRRQLRFRLSRNRVGDDEDRGFEIYGGQRRAHSCGDDGVMPLKVRWDLQVGHSGTVAVGRGMSKD